MNHHPMIRVRLGDLRIGEEFVTSIARLLGVVLARGCVRPSGYWSRSGAPRPRWPAVLCSVGGREMRLSPELVVLVAPTRSHWRVADASPDRWAEPLPLRREDLIEEMAP